MKNKIYGVTKEMRKELGEDDRMQDIKDVIFIILVMLITILLMMVLPWRT